MEFITNFISLFLYFSFLYLPFSAESKYDLINYWNSTGLTGEDINDLYKTSVDDQLAVLYVKEQEKFGEPTNALKVVIDFFLFTEVQSHLKCNHNEFFSVLRRLFFSSFLRAFTYLEGSAKLFRKTDQLNEVLFRSC